ncbi:hypothetical protein GCM10025734_81820 [Kitasatospora paranensis]
MAVAGTAVERRLADIERRCRSGLDSTALGTEIPGRLRRVVPAEAAFFATVDPVTLLFTSATAEDPLGPATALFLDNEFGQADVNKFAGLARAADPVGSLDRATEGSRTDSARYREIMAPSGSATSCAPRWSPGTAAGACSACTGRPPPRASPARRSRWCGASLRCWRPVCAWR